MATQNRTAERGGVAVFLLVGIILAAVLAGGLTFAKWRSDEVATTDQVATETQKTDDPIDEETDKAPVEEAPADEGSSEPDAATQEESADEQQPAEQDQEPESTPPVTEGETEQQDAPVASTDDTYSTPPAETQDQQVAGESAPQTEQPVATVAETGPTETMTAVAALGLLTAAFLAFRQSYARISKPGN